VADDARTYTPWSHVLTLLFAQVTHSLGLTTFRTLCASTPVPLGDSWSHAPKRNFTLSNAIGSAPRYGRANCFGRPWSTCRVSSPGFWSQASPRFAFPFQRVDSPGDSTTIHWWPTAWTGQASAAQGGGQMSSAAGPAKFFAPVCHRGHGTPQHAKKGLGSVRGPRAGRL